MDDHRSAAGAATGHPRLPQGRAWCRFPASTAGFLDKVPMGAAFAKGLSLRMGQTHVHRYMAPLLAHIEAGTIDPTVVISHRASLADAADPSYHLLLTTST